MIGAHAGLIAEGHATVAVGHEQTAVAQLDELGRNPEGDRTWNRPGLAAVVLVVLLSKFLLKFVQTVKFL